MKQLPERVKKFIDDCNITSWINYVEYLDIERNKPVMRTFAYKRTKAHGLKIQEVFREYFDHNEINDCFYYAYGGAGWCIKWQGVKKYYGYYSHSEPTYKFYKMGDKFFRPGICVSSLQTMGEIEQILKNYVPYFCIKNQTGIYSIIDFARVYKDNPRLELFAKMGFGYFYKDKMMMKASKEKLKLINVWIKNNLGFMYSHTPNYKFIINAIKNGQTGEEYRYTLRAVEIQNELKEVAEFSFDEAKQLFKYLEKQGCDNSIYKDYLIMCKKLEKDINDHSIRYPRKLMEQHDCLQALLDAEQNKALNKKLARKYKKFIKYASKLGQLKIVVPETVDDFVNWGKTLHNCVGSLGYDEKMANGNCIIIGVFKGKQIVECCELSKNLKIEQLRGLNNQDSKYHEKAEILVNSFIENVKFNRQVNAFC